MSQHLKRCGRFVTGDTTPKRPCLTTSQSPVATSINSDHLCSHDRLSKHCQKEHETAASDDYSSAPCRLDQVSAAFDAGSTPQNDTPWKFGTAPSVVQLRHRRTELRNSIAAKQQALHNLDLVKLHRAKVRCWQRTCRTTFSVNSSFLCNLLFPATFWCAFSLKH